MNTTIQPHTQRNVNFKKARNYTFWILGTSWTIGFILYNTLDISNIIYNMIDEKTKHTYCDIYKCVNLKNGTWYEFSDHRWKSVQQGCTLHSKIAEEVAKNPPASINVTGHTDTSGSATYNERLAQKRAAKVKDALIERGIPAELIVSNAMGENELLVATPDNVREPANRRVNISFN